MMDEELFRGFIVNKLLYIENEQHPVCQIFNEKTNSMPGERATKRSQKNYQKNYGRIR